MKFTVANNYLDCKFNEIRKNIYRYRIQKFTYNN